MQIFDSVDRKVISQEFTFLGISSLLIGTNAKVVIQKKETNAFHINGGIKRGDFLSTVVFNCVLHYTVVKYHVRTDS